MAVRFDQGIGQRIGISLGLVVVGVVGLGRVAVLHARPRGAEPQKLQLAQALLLGGCRDLRVRLGLKAGGGEEGGKATGGGETKDVAHGQSLARPGPGKSRERDGADVGAAQREDERSSRLRRR